MSVQAITWALGRAPNIASQAVLFSLANHANEWGITFVGQDTVAGECVCRRPTVTANMAKLEEEGLIARVRRHDGGGRRTSDVVVLGPLAGDRGSMLDADKSALSMFSADVCELARQGTDREPSPDRPSSDGASLSTLDVSLGSRGVHEPSVEPSEEPSEDRARARDPIGQVWGRYVAELKALKPRSRPKLSDGERKIIREALKARELEDVLAAVAGLFKSSWHTDGGYLGINYALRGGGRSPVPAVAIDRMAAIARGEANGRANGNGHAGILHNVVFPDGRTFDEHSSGEQLGIISMVEMGMKPWESEQPVAPATRNGSNGRVVTPDNICD